MLRCVDGRKISKSPISYFEKLKSLTTSPSTENSFDSEHGLFAVVYHPLDGIVNLCTKCEVLILLSLNQSKFIEWVDWVPKIKDTQIIKAPFICCKELAMVNLHTKFEVTTLQIGREWSQKLKRRSCD